MKGQQAATRQGIRIMLVGYVEILKEKMCVSPDISCLISSSHLQGRVQQHRTLDVGQYD